MKENKIIKFLIKKKISVSVAESCTGGMLASYITSVAGSSKIFNMGLVTYSNRAKSIILRMPKKILDKFGAVSKECCIKMLQNLKKISKSEICISTTGIAGPSGGSLAKPIGTVYIGVCVKKRIVIKKYNFNTKLLRKSIQKKTCMEALKLIKKYI
jgi:nicotinamide-nucleotide amidase